MKNLKKVLALVVVFAMMLSTVAFAGTFADVADDADFAGAIETLAALGYFKGDDNGNFNPDATITRAEYATIVCRLLGIADSATGKADFADVAADHWATGYIKMANQYGIVKGYGDGNFGPSDPVKYEEAIKMLVCALGYEPMALSKGGWPTGYVAVASQIGLLDGVGSAEGAGAVRSLVAVMTYNALDIPVMEQMGFGTEISYEIMKETDDHDKSTILTKAGIYKLGGIINVNSKVSFTDAEPTQKGYITIKVDEDYDCPEKALAIKDNADYRTHTFAVGATNAEDLVANVVNVYVAKVSSSKYEILAVEVDNSSVETLTIKASQINDDVVAFNASKPYFRYYKEGVTSGEGTKVSLDENYAAVWNNAAATKAQLADALDSSIAATIELIDSSNDGYFDIVKVYEYAHLIAEEVKADKGVVETYNGIKVDFDIENEDANVTIKDVAGNDLAIEDIEAGDVLAIMVARGTDFRPDVKIVRNAGYDSMEVIVLKNSTVTGAVTEYDATYNETYPTQIDELTIAIDGTEYDVAVNDAGIYNNDKIDLQSEGTFFIGINGDIVGFEGDKVTSNNYGLIMSAYTSSNKSVAPQLTILTKDGKEVTFDLASSVRVVGSNGKYQKIDVKDVIGTTIDTAIDGTAWENLFDTTKTFRNELYDAFGAELDEIAANDQKAEVIARFVTYKLNANNEIVEITPAVDGADEKLELAYDETNGKVAYNAGGQKLGKYLLADDAVVFDVDFINPTSSKVSDVSYFVDDSEYEALLYSKDDEGYYGAAVILSSDAVFEEGAGLAIVESKTTKLNEEDETVVKVAAYKDGAEVELTFDSDEYVEVYSNVAPEDFAVGTVLMYNADANGVVSKYAVVGTTTIGSTKSFAFDEDFADNFGVDYEDGDAFYFGWISDKTRNDATLTVMVTDAVSNKSIDASGEMFTVSKSNQYTITGTKRNPSITVGTYTDGEVDKYDADNDKAWFVLVRTFEEEVIDIISLDDNGKAAPVAEDEEEEEEEEPTTPAPTPDPEEGGEEEPTTPPTTEDETPVDPSVVENALVIVDEEDL